MLPFTRTRRVHWGDADPAGLVYSPRCFDFALAHVEDLFIELFGEGFHAFQTRVGCVLPWVHLACDYRAPVRPGDDLDLALAVLGLGARSVRYRLVARRPASGTVCFEMVMVSVAVDPATGTSCPLPVPLRAALGPYAAAAEENG
jgi:4-hydroxybenzoyl-CoA thioesterase